jgi:hypothetical protein
MAASASGNSGLALQGASPGGYRFIETALAMQGGAQVKVSLGEIRSVLQGAAQGSFGFVQSLLSSQRCAECLERLGEVRFVLDRADANRPRLRRDGPGR